MNRKSIIGLAAIALTAMACQSGSFKINGQAKGFQDNDTLLLTTDFNTGTPSDTIIVSNGRFAMQGTADSTVLTMLYLKDNPAVNVVFFREPGTVTIELNNEPGTSRVSGTEVNNQWQAMNDTVMAYSQKIRPVIEQLYAASEPDEAMQQQATEQVERLNRQMMNSVVGFAERNIGNELGYFIITNYAEDDVLTNERRLQLIEKMPATLRNRPAIKEMVGYLQEAAGTAKGSTISDFQQPTPDGTPLSIMSEVRKNKLTILDFWASWCGPCLRMVPQVKALYARYHDKGLGIVGISLDNEHNKWVAAIKEHGLNWPQVSDLQGWDNSAAKTFQVTAIPHTVLVDANGVILERGLTGDKLEAFVRQQLGD